MKSRKYLMVVSLVFMFMAFFRGNVAAYNMAEYYSLNQEDKWTYLVTGMFPMPPMLVEIVINGTELVNGVETIKSETRMPLSLSEVYSCIAMDSEGTKMYKDYGVGGFGTFRIYDPPLIFMPAQADLGESYQWSSSYSEYSIDAGTLINTGTVNTMFSIEKVEDVTVPVGAFEDCLKISMLDTYQSSDSGTIEMYHTAWFARNFRDIKHDVTVKMSSLGEEDIDFTMTMELIRATVDGVNHGCLATSALGGDSRGNDLNRLRKFRDEVLSKTPQGKELIRLYYEWSPVIVKAMEEDEEFKEEVKEMIDGFLGLVEGEL